MKPASLAMTARLHSEVFDRLFPGDGLESAAILLCNQGKGRRCQRLVVADVIYPEHGLSERRENFVSWPFENCLPPEKISDIDLSGQSIVTIHSHPKGIDGFSEVDDENDRELFSSVCSWFDDGRRNGSAIMLSDGRVRARTVDARGGFSDMETISVVGDDIKLWKTGNPGKRSPYHSKLSQTFGGGTLDLLRGMRVGVVGCSGTGSVVIELLVRNCVGELVIADDDIVEEKNLNRIINGTEKMARDKQPKVHAIERAIKEIGIGTKVDACLGLTDSPWVVEALVDCDVVFGCVDSAFGRYHLDCLASAYLIPYFDVGVNLEADGEGGIKAADAVSHYVHPEGGSLLSREAYTMEQVKAEDWRRTNPDYYENQRRAGYLAEVGEEQPAVMSLNMQAACMAFNDFMARIHGYRFDGNGEFGTQTFRLVHGCYENSADTGTPHRLMEKYMGTGDGSLLVKNNTRR